MSNIIRVSNWKILIIRANGIIEAEKITVGAIVDIYDALKKEGRKVSILNKYDLISNYIFRHSDRINSKSPIIKFEIEAGS